MAEMDRETAEREHWLTVDLLAWLSDWEACKECEARARHEAFARHLDEAARIVSTWPEWKQNILGRPASHRGENR